MKEPAAIRSDVRQPFPLPWHGRTKDTKIGWIRHGNLSDWLYSELFFGKVGTLLFVRNCTSGSSALAVWEGLPAVQKSDSSAGNFFLVLGRRSGVSMSEVEPSAAGLDVDDMDLYGIGIYGVLDRF